MPASGGLSGCSCRRFCEDNLARCTMHLLPRSELTWTPRIVILVLSPLQVLCFSNCCLPKHPVRSAQLLASVAHSERPQKGEAPRRIPVSYKTQGRESRG